MDERNISELRLGIKNKKGEIKSFCQIYPLNNVAGESMKLSLSFVYAEVIT
ncbi:hypothetical protein [Microbulbifer sp. JMSA002]|uniref:hypothetical protein n=1 Tax=Microbulbifer sp. JMSA002 TaxID=3243368 RepID=UPI00403914CE